MLTTDLALRFDPAYEKISRRFHEHPEAVRRRVRAGLVQAHPSRHGPDRALSRPAGAEGDADLAGPDPGGRSSADRRAGHRGAEGEDPGLGPVGLAAGLDGVGVGLDVPRLRQARRRERRAHSPRAAEGLGGQPAGRSSPRCCRRSKASRRSSTPASRRQEGLAGRPDRARRRRGGREGREGRRARRDGAVHAGPHGRLAGADRRRIVRAARAHGRRVPQLLCAASSPCRPRRRWSTARSC